MALSSKVGSAVVLSSGRWRAPFTPVASRHAQHPCTVQRSFRALYVPSVVSQRTVVATQASASSAAGDAGQGDPKLRLVNEQADRLAGRYSVLATAAAVLAVTLLVFPASFIILQVGGSPPAREVGVARLIGATLWGPAAALWSLKDAASHDRLGSDTYKRLNVGLTLWGVLLAGISLLHAKAISNVFWLQAFLGAAAAVVCGTTARNNGAGFPEPGVLPTRFQQNRTEFSWIFIALAVVTGFLGLSLLAVPFATFEPSKWRPLATPMGSYLLRNYGCSVLFSSILFYTLKDAEDRGRSTSSTFQLTARAILLMSVCGVATFLSGGLVQAAARDGLLAVISAIFLAQRRKKPQKS